MRRFNMLRAMLCHFYNNYDGLRKVLACFLGNRAVYYGVRCDFSALPFPMLACCLTSQLNEPVHLISSLLTAKSKTNKQYLDLIN
jgi:hypothetical protein